MPSRPAWSDTTATFAAASAPKILAALSSEPQSQEAIADRTGVGPLHVFHVLGDLCSRGLARRKRHPKSPDTFVITDAGIQYRDRLQEKQKQKQKKRKKQKKQQQK